MYCQHLKIMEVEQVTERLSDKNPCDSCKVDRQIGNPNRWQCECDRCDKPNDWKNECVKKLAEYETAEEDGRLVVLPCKPWDKVYQLFVTDLIDKKLIYKIFQAKVTKITIDRFRTIFSFETLDENKYKSDLTMESFGETVFLTREEAEKALKEMEGK